MKILFESIPFWDLLTTIVSGLWGIVVMVWEVSPLLLFVLLVAIIWAPANSRR